MKGLWLENGHLQYREDLPEPDLLQDEALISVLLAGICRTDLELTRGYYPFQGIPGHEFVGVVEACPSDSGWIGQRVTGEINAACGECDFCRKALPIHCRNRSVLGIVGRNGCHGERVTLPVRNLHVIPQAVSDEAAVFVEPLAAALRIPEVVHLRPTDRVLVIGAGKLGQLVARVVQRTGCSLSVLARHRRQQELLEAAGIPSTATADHFKPASFDLVVEAGGRPECFGLASTLVKPMGTIVLKSTYAGLARIDLSRVVVGEIQVIGSRCGPFEPAVGALASAWIDPQTLIDAVLPLAEGAEAFHLAGRPGVLKILLKV